LATNAGDVWVYGNVTEHMADYWNGLLASGQSVDLVRLNVQAMLTSFQGAVEIARQGAWYGQTANVEGWELALNTPRQAGQLPALIHGIYDFPK
jgi:hypothetical protein